MTSAPSPPSSRPIGTRSRDGSGATSRAIARATSGSARTSSGGQGSVIDGPAFLGDEVKLKEGTHLIGPVIVDKYSVVDEDARVINSVIWPHTYIGEGCLVRQAVIGRGVTIKNNTVVEEGAVVGDDCVIGKGSRVQAGVRIWPHKEIAPGSTVNDSVVWAGEWRRGLFASWGMTGLINIELTPEFCARLGAAFAATLPRGATIAVARDHARSSRMIKRALISGMVSGGARVRDLEELPVPVTQFATRYGRSEAGVHVLVSPFDQRSADIRFFDRDGLPIDKRAERRLEALYYREDFRRAAFYEMGDIEEHITALPDYVQHLLASVDAEAIRAAGFRLVIDYDYSQASQVLPDVLHRLGVTTVPLNAGVAEGPRHRTVPEETALITRTVHADLGCLFNPTGERLEVIDDQGCVLTGYQLFGLLARWWSHRGAMLAPASAPQWLRGLVEEQGSGFVATIGEPNQVLRAAASPDVCLATDGEGGMVWPYFFGAFDAMYTLVKLLELRAAAASRSRRPPPACRGPPISPPPSSSPGRPRAGSCAPCSRSIAIRTSTWWTGSRCSSTTDSCWCGRIPTSRPATSWPRWVTRCGGTPCSTITGGGCARPGATTARRPAPTWSARRHPRLRRPLSRPEGTGAETSRCSAGRTGVGPGPVPSALPRADPGSVAGPFSLLFRGQNRGRSPALPLCGGSRRLRSISG